MSIALQSTIICESTPVNSFDAEWNGEKFVKAKSEDQHAVKQMLVGTSTQAKKKDPVFAGSDLTKLTLRNLLATEPAEYYRSTGAICGPLHCGAAPKYQGCSG